MHKSTTVSSSFDLPHILTFLLHPTKTARKHKRSGRQCNVLVAEFNTNTKSKIMSEQYENLPPQFANSGEGALVVHCNNKYEASGPMTGHNI